MEFLSSFLREFGEVNGLLILAVALMFLWVRSSNKIAFRQYEERIKDRQKEIDRLAADNHAYREKYLKSLDKPSDVEVPK